MKINTDIKKQFLLCVVVLAITAAYMFLRILPLHSKASQLASESEQQHQVIRQGLEAQAKLSKTRMELEQLEAEIGDFRNKIPTKRSMGQLLQKIADLMDENSLADQVVRPGNEEQLKELTRIPVTMECRGRLEQIFDFYHSLEELDRLVRVEFIELNSQASDGGIVKMRTQASVYYEPVENSG